jgi:hypothetical protein
VSAAYASRRIRAPNLRNNGLRRIGKADPLGPRRDVLFAQHSVPTTCSLIDQAPFFVLLSNDHRPKQIIF